MVSRPRRSVYVPQEIEPKWQKSWVEHGVMKADDSSDKPKYYDLVMYPYPSGDLTVGHARNYVMGDVQVARRVWVHDEVVILRLVGAVVRLHHAVLDPGLLPLGLDLLGHIDATAGTADHGPQILGMPIHGPQMPPA